MNTAVIIGQPLSIDIKTVQIPEKPTQETIAGGYGWISPSILKVENLIHNPGSRHMGIWHPNKEISSDDAFETINSMTTVIKGKTFKGCPATIEELASYEVLFHKELDKTVLVALGEKVRNDSGDCVAYRGVVDSKNRHGLDDWLGVWNSSSGFLVVFEEVLETE
jgi:hypothetical protein